MRIDARKPVREWKSRDKDEELSRVTVFVI